MSAQVDWKKLIETTRKSAKAAADLSASLYAFVSSLQAEAIKEQESKDKGS